MKGEERDKGQCQRTTVSINDLINTVVIVSPDNGIEQCGIEKVSRPERDDQISYQSQ